MCTDYFMLLNVLERPDNGSASNESFHIWLLSINLLFLFRFCPAKYYPFDHNVLDKYIVGDDYLPIWEVPALDYYYNELGFGMKESLNAYLRSRGQDPSFIWNQIEEAIRTIILAKESQIVNILHR